MWVSMVVGKYIYLESVSENLASNVFHLLYVFLFTAQVYLIFSLAGSYYVKAEIPRIGNENLLNGLKEGVYVIDEES